MRLDSETPVPHEPDAPRHVGRQVGALVIASWMLVAVITAGLWLAGGWMFTLAGWLLILGLLGLLAGSAVR